MTEQKTSLPAFYNTSRVVNEYTFHFDCELGPAEDYRDLSQVLFEASPDDTINLLINGPGGHVDTAAQLVNLIINCKGTVIGHLVGPSASAYCSIFLACHAWVVHPHATLMAHTFSGGFCEKGNEIRKSYESYTKFVEDMMIDLYYPFFSLEEISSMTDHNKNIYLNSEEIIKRINILAEHRQGLGSDKEEK